MSFKKLLIALTLFFAAVCSLSALSIDITYNYDGDAVEPDSKKRRDDDLVGVIIKTNIDDVDVLINGKSFGKTPVATVDLSASYYTLELRKSGYDTIRCKIYPRKRYTYTYNFVMIKTCGYIDVTNVPSGSVVYVDGMSRSSFPVEVDPGTHSVKVRKFGYDDYKAQVKVENHKTTNLAVSLKVSPFAINDFSVSKNVINPDYNSGIGKVTFSFNVTNDGSAILSVNDRYGNPVWVHEYKSFSTWEQSISWDGRGSEGERLPDGQYTVNLYSFDYDLNQPIKIDRSLIYPLSVPTAAGSGIGTLPCAFSSGMNYVNLYTNFGPMLNVADGKVSLYSLPVTAGILIDFANHFELGGSFGYGAATDKAVADGKNPFMGGASFKGTGSVKLGSNMALNFAGLIHYNYCSLAAFTPADTSLANGLGFGAAMGMELSPFYVGLSADYSLGKDMNTDYSDLKCGAVLSVTPAKNMRTSVWGALHNAKTVEAGTELILMPASSAFCFDTKASVMTDLDSKGKNLLINAQIGLSYLF